MKILCKNSFVLLWVVCFGLVLTSESQAKVCFVGDPDCAQGAEFDEYADPNEDGESCTSEGYVLKTECDADASKHITGYCPYNSNYVMCCGNEYVYDACVYPHVPVDKCGSKWKCQCDPKKYPYTEETCHTQFKFSNPGGTACTQIDAGATETTKTLYYSACLCERGLYPYSKDDCQTTANADVNGDPCTDSMGNQYWDSCKCSNPPYKWESIDCEFGGKGKACVQGGVYFFKECCSCAAFPAEGERGGRPNDEHATKWTTCDCPRKGRFHITQCESGWQPNDDGSACERISCENAVKLFFSKPNNRENYKGYGIFNGSKLVHYAQLTEAELAKLPEAQQTYAVGEEIEAGSASIGVLAANVSVKSSTCSVPSSGGIATTKCEKAVCQECKVGIRNEPDQSCSVVDRTVCKGLRKKCTKWFYLLAAPEGNSFGYHLGCTKAATIFSGAHFGSLASTPDHIMLQEACGANDPEKTVVPKISFSGSSFPNTSSGYSNTISITGAELSFSGSTQVNRVLSLNNTTVSGYGATFNKEVTLTRNEAKPNGMNTTFKMTGSTFKNKLTSNGYNFDIGSGYLYMIVPSSYKNRTFASITLSDGGSFNGGYWYVYPDGDKKQEYYKTTILVKGPTSGAAGNINTNLSLGYRSGYGYAREMTMQLSGNLLWNLYNGSKNYTITLSPNSQIYSSDYGSGDYAKIKYSSNGYWKKCAMRDRQGIPWRHRWWVPFKCKESNHCNNTTWSADYIVCDVNKDNKSTIKHADWYSEGDWKTSNKNVCPGRADKIYKDDSSCSFSSDHCAAERYFNCES